MAFDKKLVQLSKHIYFLPFSTNIGVIALDSETTKKNIYLIESGNDETQADLIFQKISSFFPDFELKAVINTHSHADHCGGNNYFKRKTNCQIWASKGEGALMECPTLETGLIWGGNPVQELKTPYFVAEVCQVDKTFSNTDTFFIENLKIEVIPLDGHYIDQTGFLISDTDGKQVLFAGDALSGRNVISRYWIQYLFDEKRTKESLMRLSKIKADYYVPGHGQIVEHIEGLVELNILALLETENLILEELKEPKTSEQVLKAVADRNGINLKLSQYVLIGCTIRSYLSSLCDEGKIKYEIKDNTFFWSKV